MTSDSRHMTLFTTMAAGGRIVGLISLLMLAAALCQGSNQNGGKYQPNWASIDSRPLPAWYDEAKLGIFIHWGVFSVPSAMIGEWFWWYWKGLPNPKVEQFMIQNYRPDFAYGDFAKDFTAEFFNAHQWATLFEASGAK